MLINHPLASERKVAENNISKKAVIGGSPTQSTRKKFDMIEFLIANWLLFLCATIVGYIAALGLQRWNMKKIVNMDIADGFGGFFRRFGAVALFGILGSISGILLIVSIVLNAIEYFSA